MARFRDESIPINALVQQLHPGEQLRHWAYGVKQPPMGLIILLMLLAILPGAIAVALLTKEYVVGLTDYRLIVIRFSGGKVNIKEVAEYDRRQIWGRVRASKGAIFTHLTVDDPQKPFVAKFHRAGGRENKVNAEAMADQLAPPMARVA